MYLYYYESYGMLYFISYIVEVWIPSIKFIYGGKDLCQD